MKKNKISKILSLFFLTGMGASLSFLGTSLYKDITNVESESKEEIKVINEDELYPTENISFHHWKFEKMYDDLLNFDYNDSKNENEIGFLPVDPRTMTEQERKNFVSKEFIDIKNLGLPLINDWELYFERPSMPIANFDDHDKNLLTWEELGDLAFNKEEAHLAIFKALRSLDELYTSYKYVVHTRAFAYNLLIGNGINGTFERIKHSDDNPGSYWWEGEHLTNDYYNYGNLIEPLFNLRNIHGNINITIAGKDSWGVSIGGPRNQAEHYFDDTLTMTDVNKLYDVAPMDGDHNRSFGWNGKLLGQEDTSANKLDMWTHEMLHWVNPVDNGEDMSGVSGWTMEEVQHNFMPNHEFKDPNDIFWTFGSEIDNEYLEFAWDASFLYDENYINPAVMVKRGWIPLASRNSTYWLLGEYDKIDLKIGWFGGYYDPDNPPLKNSNIDDVADIKIESSENKVNEGWTPYRPCACVSCLNIN